MKNFIKICSILFLVLFGSIYNVKAIDVNNTQYNTEEEIAPLAFEQIVKTKTYEDTAKVRTASGGEYSVRYRIRVVYSLSFNSNTYKIASVTEPRIVIDYLVLSTDYGGAYAFLDNQSVTCNMSADRLTANYYWSFTIKCNVGGTKYTFKTISESAKINV